MPLQALLFLPQIRAWGTLGHTTIAFIAQDFVQPETEAYFQNILKNSSSEYLANVATWADSFRYTKAGRFSAGFHYSKFGFDFDLSVYETMWKMVEIIKEAKEG